jgi:cytoskeletal protein RodZ
MSEIGETLRERRMALKVDIQEVEEATKIRAKYLRALENGEYGLLPGSAYVKSFLRTYADYLGLDSRDLVDRYRALGNYGEDDSPLPSGRVEIRSRPPRWALAVAFVLALAVLLLLVGLLVGGAK